MRRKVVIDRERGRAIELDEDGRERELADSWLQLDELAEWQAYRRQRDEENQR